MEDISEVRACDRHGEYTSKCFKIHENSTIWTACGKCITSKQEAEDRQEFEERCTNAAIPKRYWGRSFESFIATTRHQKEALDIAQNYVRDWEQHRTSGHVLIMCGKVGTGKTHLACSIGQSLLAKKRTVTYTTLDAMVEAFTDLWGNKHQADERSIPKKYEWSNLLILDELNLVRGTEIENKYLFRVINQRYNTLSPLILIGNFTPKEFQQGLLPDQITSRLTENYTLMICDWEDYRRKN